MKTMPKSKLPAFQRARQPDQIKQREEAILQAALALFEEKGLENVTLGDIAARVGTATSNLYRYFESREHIYLRTVQRLAGEWEQRVIPPLEKLKDKGTLPKVIAIFAESYLKSPQYGELITVANAVLEKKLTASLVIDFRTVFLERRKRLARVLAAALPGVTFEKLFPLTLHLFVHVPGLWPFCHPTRASKRMLQDPQYAHLNLDFKVEISRFLEVFFKGMLG